MVFGRDKLNPCPKLWKTDRLGEHSSMPPPATADLHPAIKARGLSVRACAEMAIASGAKLPASRRA